MAPDSCAPGCSAGSREQRLALADIASRAHRAIEGERLLEGHFGLGATALLRERRWGALALQLEATISTWCDRDLDLAGVVLDAAGGQGVVPVDLAGGTGVAHRSPLV